MFETKRASKASKADKMASKGSSPPASPYKRLPLCASSSSNWSTTDESTGDWDLDMDCDIETESLEQVCELAKARMPAQARMGLPATYSDSGFSISSSASTSSLADDEPELSRSFDSSRSYFPLTPARQTPAQRPCHPIAAPHALASNELSQLGLREDQKRRDSIGQSPRSGLRSTIYNRNTAVPESPKSGPTVLRGSLGQSLGLSGKTKPSMTVGVTNAPVHGSPLSGKQELLSDDAIAEQATTPRSLTFTAPATTTSLTTRRKLPPLAIAGTSRHATSMMPQTPGGSLFAGARDGAATGGQTPVSPFVPPTPLVAACGGQAAATETKLPPPSYPSEKKRGSLPNIFSPMTVRSPIMQRQGSLGPMSPLSRDFANVSMHATPPPAASVSSQDSAWSTSTSLTTPPFSPLATSKVLTPLGISDEDPMRTTRESSGGSNTSDSGRSKKRSKEEVGVHPQRDESTLGAARPKLLKSKSSSRTSPYPTKESPLMASPQARSKASLESNKTLSPSPSPPTGLVPLASAHMEKSLSAPPQPPSSEPKTVSAKHLSSRLLHPVFAAKYTLGDELGSGGFGFVVSATRNSDGMPLAVKFIWKDKVPSHGWVRDPVLGVIPLEAFVLRVVDHPCVVKFIELFDDDAFFYLVMEMHGTPWKAPEPDAQESTMAPSAEEPRVEAPANPQVAVYAPDSSKPSEAVILAESPTDSANSGSTGKKSGLAPPARPAPMERRTSRDLFECIEQHTRFPEDRAAWVFAQIVEAVYFLDKLGICHRDIKDENCVIDSDWNVKLIDFGSAVISDPRKPPPYFNRFFGTMTFASAEILHGQQYRAPHAEVWSLGVLLSILLSGECPFSDPSAAKKGRISSRVRNSWSPEALNLLMGCVHVDPDRRATISQVREHPWVRRAWSARGLQRPSAPQFY